MQKMMVVKRVMIWKGAWASMWLMVSRRVKVLKRVNGMMEVLKRVTTLVLV